MLFAFEQIAIASTTTKLTENTYTISSQHADYALFSLNGGSITVRYDGSSPAGGTPLIAGNYVLESREQIQGFRAESLSGSPVIDIQYVSLEWPNIRRLYIEKIKEGFARSTKSNTQVVSLGTGSSQYRRVYNRPEHQFEVESVYKSGMYSEQDLYGFFTYHQGDKSFLFHAGKYSITEYPVLVGYGDGTTEAFFLPARYIMPYTLKVFFDGIEVESYSLNESSGLLTFYTAPPNNVVITSTYSRYYKSVFMDDQLDDKLLGDTKNKILTYKLKEVIP